jgi:hypothetical protein
MSQALNISSDAKSVKAQSQQNCQTNLPLCKIKLIREDMLQESLDYHWHPLSEFYI